MPERKPLLLLITTLVVVALAVGGVAIFMLYRAALGEERERLLAVARAEARLIDAVARVPSGADTDQWDETLRDIVAEQRGGSVLGEGGQLSVVRRRGADIEVLGLGTAGATTQMPWSAAETDPYRRVLEGEPGTAVMRAADGEWRLYAYEPIARLEAGVVAAIALDEVQQPFVRAGMAAAWAGAVLIALGTVVLVRVVQPLLVRLVRVRPLKPQKPRSRIKSARLIPPPAGVPIPPQTSRQRPTNRLPTLTIR